MYSILIVTSVELELQGRLPLFLIRHRYLPPAFRGHPCQSLRHTEGWFGSRFFLKMQSLATYPIVCGDLAEDGTLNYLSMRNELTGFSPDTVFAGVRGCAAFGQWKNISVTVDRTMWSTTVRVDGVDASIIRNGVNMYISVPFGNPTGKDICGLGGNDGARVPDSRVVAICDIAEVLIDDRVFSNSLRDSVERYLAAKYRIAP